MNSRYRNNATQIAVAFGRSNFFYHFRVRIIFSEVIRKKAVSSLTARGYDGALQASPLGFWDQNAIQMQENSA